MTLLGGVAQMAYGGTTGSGVEVEGKEAFETPGGAVGTFKGPSHEAGGIDVNLPPGTEVYSKRIKIDGVTLANRKTKREKRSLTLEELLEADKTDNLIKNSLTRTKTVNEKEEALLLETISLESNIRLGCQIPITENLEGLEIELVPLS